MNTTEQLKSYVVRFMIIFTLSIIIGDLIFIIWHLPLYFILINIIFAGFHSYFIAFNFQFTKKYK